MAPEQPAFELRSERQDGTHLVAATGELDMAVAPQLESALGPDADGAGAVLLDLTELEFMDSAGLRVLLLASERFRDAGTPWAVAIPEDSAVRRMLSLSETENSLPVFGSRDEASASLDDGAG